MDVTGRAYVTRVDQRVADWKEKHGEKVSQGARRVLEALNFVSSNMLAEGFSAHRPRVHVSRDKTVDGELAITVRPEEASERRLVGQGSMVARLAEHFMAVMHNKIPEAYFQLGFYLPAETQVVLQQGHRPYRRYQGALRGNYKYLQIGRTTAVAARTFESFKLTVLGILKKHERPLTGIYVRIAWSEDAKLHRR